jgi:hypothetical protein
MRASNILLMAGLVSAFAATAPQVAFADDPLSDIVDTIMSPMTPADPAPEAATPEQPAHSHQHCHSRTRCHAHGHAGNHHR